MSEIRSYIPEAFFLDQKDEDHMRVCREDLVLVDPADGYRVVVGRGKEILAGEPFAPLVRLSRSERQFLEQSLGRKMRLLLQGKNEPILVFADLLEASGLLLVICPRFDTENLKRGLALLGKSEFISSNRSEAGAPSPRNGDAAVCKYLQELFYYLDRIFSVSEELRLWTTAALIANLAGCHANFAAMPTEAVTPLPMDRLRLLAFLLCLFLSMREEAISATATGEVSELSISLSASPLLPTGKASACNYRFLQLPAFRDISISLRNGGWVLEASFCKKTEHAPVRAKDSLPICLVAFFQYAS